MENKKSELGNIYGSRISKNGNWLNLSIITHIEGKEVYITCPVRINNTLSGKPYARVEEGKAAIYEIKVYEDVKQSQEQQQEQQPIADDDIPF